ncbi:MAG: aminopeptidase [Sphaerochaetaceae bacterium]
MNDVLKRYAQLVIKSQLQLKQGESLSINSESSTIEFARLLAKLACEVTIEPVQIVETNEGKIKQVFPIDPEENDALRPNITGFVMCHLVNLNECPYLSAENPWNLISDVSLLGKFGLLAEPVLLDRRIAVPWANVPIPGANWGLQYLDANATEEDLWKFFASLLRLDTDDPSRFWIEQGNMLFFRKRKLNLLRPRTLDIVGDGWSIQLDIAKGTQWCGGEQTAKGQRHFFSSLPLQHLFTSVDCKSAKGTFSSTRAFLLLGKQVEGASFVIEEGKVVSYTAESGGEALDAFFSIDEGAKHICSLSLADENTLESRCLVKAAHPLFNNAMTSLIGFGGFSLDTLASMVEEKDLDELHLGQSLVRCDIPIGSNSLSVTTTNSEGETVQLVDEGIFID